MVIANDERIVQSLKNNFGDDFVAEKSATPVELKFKTYRWKVTYVSG